MVGAGVGSEDGSGVGPKDGGYRARYERHHLGVFESAEEAALEAEEHFHFERVVGSFTGYEAAVAADARRTERAAARLAPELRALLPPDCLARRAAGPVSYTHLTLPTSDLV